MIHPTQQPNPGSQLMAYKGDTIEFTLTLPESVNNRGKAFLRTNLGNVKVLRREIIDAVENNLARRFRDWQDWPMDKINGSTFRLILPLLEIGYFEAKAFYVLQNRHEPVWPEGPNVGIKVEPADYCGANIVYNSFIRQLGPNKDGGFDLKNFDKAAIKNLDENSFAVIPPSGTFRDLVRELDFIVGKLGCRIIQLLPIHPTPTVYGRMGRFGSPFASLDFLDVDPALAEFDRKTTPLQQFEELVDQIHSKHAKIFLDIAINHTGWASKLQVEHPDWFVRDKDDSFFSPRAWGVVWEDLSKLDYNHRDLWKYIAETFLTWCERGVDGFRCDAGYKIPWKVWEYIVAKVREEFPDTIFLLEGLGGKVSTTVELLTKANLNWAYSELFQNYDRSHIESYLPSSLDISHHQGLLVHFAETHDNNRLAATSQKFSRLRTALAALTSRNGAYGFANGLEWFATEKILVHEAKSLNWHSPINQVDFISRLSSILSTHPAFQRDAITRMVQKGDGNSIAVFRNNPKADSQILVLINLDHDKANPVKWQPDEVGMDAEDFYDLLSESTVKVSRHNGWCSYSLNPGDVFCLTPHESERCLKTPFALPCSDRDYQNVFQRLVANALEIFNVYNGFITYPKFEGHELAQKLHEDPREFCQWVNPAKGEIKVVSWDWPWDSHREVMVPPNFFLYLTAADHFRVEIKNEKEVFFQGLSLPRRDGLQFVLIPPLPPPERHLTCSCILEVYSNHQCIHTVGHILYLSEFDHAEAKKVVLRSDVLDHPLSMLCTNGRGGMSTMNIAWGRLESRYDALLAGNLNSEYPEDRQIMLTRCRIWMIYKSFSREVNLDCLDHSILLDNSRVVWRFVVPFYNGKIVHLDILIEAVENENAIRIYFHRRGTSIVNPLSNDTSPIKLVIKPDIEDRNFHEDTKAYSGPEDSWPKAITLHGDGFSFSPDPSRDLQVSISKGEFIVEDEWQYMIHHKIEEERGLEAYSDLYCPGYFSLSLNQNDCVVLSAAINTPDGLRANPKTESPIGERKEIMLPQKLTTTEPLATALLKAMKHFIVKRQNHKTVIAGYPWFLDWGRDTLICARGMIAAGMLDEVKAIIKQFAQFEDHGTLPNMIRGKDVGDRDTSDAPLWFIVACSDLVCKEKVNTFISTHCGGRSILEILKSIINNYISGTSNGIRMDPESGLIFSPSHFTWMDTNFPSGTPRQGYPIEIQALWYAALKFVSKVAGSSNWQKLARRVEKSILTHFFREDLGYFSDCLHANFDHAAASAQADDHLRPNQLLTITLGAIQDEKTCQKVLSACERLLIPGGIRSLHNSNVRHPLPVYQKEQLLNDPFNPYWGRYEGDEDQRRKPAYHNGTAWTWIFPSFCEAWYKVYKKSGRKTALAILGSSTQALNSGCLGQIPEIFDGDYPHRPRGCVAQAWGVTELYRVISLVKN